MKLIEKLVKINRNTTVTKGGRKFSFSVIVVAGDQKGHIGYGFGKASEIVDARLKASYQAKKNIFKVPLRQQRTLHHNITTKFCSAKVIMKPAVKGTGIIAGGSIRSIFPILGIKDIIVKSLGSNNSNNLIKAVIVGLKNINTPEMIAVKKCFVNVAN